VALSVYRASKGLFVENDQKGSFIEAVSLDFLLQLSNPEEFLKASLVAARSSPLPSVEELMAPIANQEVWAAGVTYYRCRNARMEESKDAGGAHGIIFQGSRSSCRRDTKAGEDSS
jgi:2-dehydro-3-deoxy-D-arabinonate dehydratase